MTPVIRGVRFYLAHAPGLVAHGSKPSRDIARDPALAGTLRAALRPFAAARDYPPTQVFLGALPPEALRARPRPWADAAVPSPREGPHGEIAPEEELLGLIRAGDEFDLVALERGFAAEARAALAAHPLATPADLARLDKGASDADLDARLAGPAPALSLALPSGRRVGAVIAGHEDDQTLAADVLLENLATKATATMALRGLLAAEGLDPARVDYVLNSGEEAIGDRYQRGGGNLAKAVAAGCRLHASHRRRTSRLSAAAPCMRSRSPAASWRRGVVRATSRWSGAARWPSWA